MIIVLKKNSKQEKIEETCRAYEGIILNTHAQDIIITSSKYKSIDKKNEEIVDKIFVFDNDMQLSSKKYQPNRLITINGIKIGESSKNTVIVAGPCSIESKEQIELSAELLKSNGIKFLRAGSYKPRTSPYTFQGMGLQGLKMLASIREKYGLMIVSEVRDHSHVDEVIEYADIVQIGAKAMYDQGILRKCSKINKPVLLKRGFGSNIQEFLQSAEFLLSGGNEKVIVCERGIRTFENKTRFTLDLCGVAYIKEYANLPVFLDPSHAMGYSYGIPDLARACVAMGIEGLMIETHPDPSQALSDSSQQLNHDEFTAMLKSLYPIAKAVGREIL